MPALISYVKLKVKGQVYYKGQGHTKGDVYKTDENYGHTDFLFGMSFGC